MALGVHVGVVCVAGAAEGDEVAVEAPRVTAVAECVGWALVVDMQAAVTRGRTATQRMSEAGNIAVVRVLFIAGGRASTR